MSKQNFDALFQGYPADSPIRQQVKQAITTSITALERAKKAADSATLDNRDPLQTATTTLDTIDIWFVKGLPPEAGQTIARLLRPFYAAMQAYNQAASKRRGTLRRKGRVTEAEFAAYKNKLNETADNLITWLKSIKP